MYKGLGTICYIYFEVYLYDLYHTSCLGRSCVVASGVNDGTALASLSTAGAVTLIFVLGVAVTVGAVGSVVGVSLTVVGEHASASL